MGYHLATLRRQPQRRPQPVTLLPLSDASSAPRFGISRGLLIAIAIVIVLLFLMWLLMPRERQLQQRNPVRKMSTAELAKNLYERLDRRGGANQTTLRSLEAYSRKRS